jgi:zinc transport system substrate-binding protein
MRSTLALALSLIACGGQPQPDATRPAPRDGPLVVRSLSAPAHWLVERVGDDQVQLTPVLPPGEDASHWRPDAALIAGLAQADLIVGNGAGWEGWVATATLPEDRLVLTADGLELVRTQTTTHSHSSGGSHSHGTVDPHSFGSPALFAQQATVLADRLGRADPVNAPRYQERASALGQELAAISTGYREVFERAGESRFAANRPSYRYLARELGVQIRDIILDPTHPPDEQAMAELEAWMDGAADPVLLWESEPSAEVLAVMPAGMRHLALDPLDLPPQGGHYDYLAQARANLTALGDLFPLVVEQAEE